MTRFLLDLRSIYYTDTSEETGTTTAKTTQFSDARFAPNLAGNLGAPLAGTFGESLDSEESTLEFSEDPMTMGTLGSMNDTKDEEMEMESR